MKMTKNFLIIFSLISGYLVLLVMFLETAFNPLPFGVFALVTIIFAGLACGKLFLHSGNKKLRFFSPFSFAFSWLAVFVLISGMMVMTFQNYVALKRAENIIEKVDLYFESHGSYPTELEQIQSESGASLAATFPAFFYRPFFYSQQTDHPITDNTKTFSLEFDSYFGTKYVFDAGSDKWTSKSKDISIKPENIFALNPNAATGILGLGIFGRKHLKK